MSDVTRILNAIEQGEPQAADELLPFVYDELRKLAAQRLAQEKPGQTLVATALVHEAYLRLVNSEQAQRWDSRGHFFAAAAEAMRRILIENARRKKRVCHGGGRDPIVLPEDQLLAADQSEEMFEIHDALDELAALDAQAANLVKLRFFVGMTMHEAAEALGLPERTAYRTWDFAKAWLFRRIHPDENRLDA
jgi:RNA polymerase sigma factor (TIGR02999 family)